MLNPIFEDEWIKFGFSESFYKVHIEPQYKIDDIVFDIEPPTGLLKAIPFIITGRGWLITCNGEIVKKKLTKDEAKILISKLIIVGFKYKGNFI